MRWSHDGTKLEQYLCLALGILALVGLVFWLLGWSPKL